MQKSILLHLDDGGTTSIGTDHYVMASRSEEDTYTTLVYETLSEDAGMVYVTETPEEVHEMLNALK